MSKDTGGPAFPVNTANIPNAGACFAAEGVTLRDYFAAKAMQAAATNSVGAECLTFAERANWAYQQADAMLAERNNE